MHKDLFIHRVYEDQNMATQEREFTVDCTYKGEDFKIEHNVPLYTEFRRGQLIKVVETRVEEEYQKSHEFEKGWK